MTSPWLSIGLYRDDRELVARCLSEHLLRGRAALFLGAGASSEMGLPLWWKLVRNCQDATNATTPRVTKNTSSEKLRRAMDEVEILAGNVDNYCSLVREHLYAKVKDDDALIGQPLLVALGAMMMKSKRGNCETVLTLNFDDVLERYLRLHGFVAQSVVKMPTRLGDSDVRIYHPHGFLPSESTPDDDSRSLVFSQFSYDKLFYEHGAWWNLVLEVLLDKPTLFVGMSCNDPTIGPLLSHAMEKLTNEPDARPTGFWLLGPKDPSPDSEDFLERRNVVPVRLPDCRDYFSFLLQVCRKAATLALRT